MTKQHSPTHKSADQSQLVQSIQHAELHAELESIGRSLAATDFLNILDLIALKKLPQSKLAPILVGLSPDAFLHSIQSITKDSLQVLKLESTSEPLLHHLTLFVNNTKVVHQKLLDELESLRHAFTHFVREELSYQILRHWIETLHETSVNYQNDLATIDIVLEICWNTDRIDLIEKLSRMKEHAYDQLVTEIGHPSDGEYPSTGLYAILKESLEYIFNEVDLPDDAPSMEGMVQFSVWYLKDYWEVGLLPSLKIIEQLETPPGSSEQDNIKHKQKFFKQVEENLVKLGIPTVGDLKSAAIFSKKMLKEFVLHNQGLL